MDILLSILFWFFVFIAIIVYLAVKLILICTPDLTGNETSEPKQHSKRSYNNRNYSYFEDEEYDDEDYSEYDDYEDDYEEIEDYPQIEYVEYNQPKIPLYSRKQVGSNSIKYLPKKN
jgi:hypothetical protein